MVCTVVSTLATLQALFALVIRGPIVRGGHPEDVLIYRGVQVNHHVHHTYTRRGGQQTKGQHSQNNTPTRLSFTD